MFAKWPERLAGWYSEVGGVSARVRSFKTASSALRARAARLGRQPVLVIGLFLVLVQMLWHGSITLRSYFWQDDFRYLEEAHRQGMTWSYLFQDISQNGHLMPGEFAVVWLVSKAHNFSFVWPAVTLITTQAVASLLLLWVLWRLFPRRPEILVALAVYLFSPLRLVVATWWAAGLQALPLQCAMLLSIGCYVNFTRNHRARWLVGTALGLILGLFFWEKAVLIVPLLLLVGLLVLEQEQSLKTRFRRLLEQWPLWLALAAVGAAYASVYLRFAASVVRTNTHPDIGPFVSNAVVKTLMPGLFGGPWTGKGGESTLYPLPSDLALAASVLALLLLVGGSFLRRGPAAAKGWILVFTYVAMDLILVLVGRADFAEFLSRDPKYLTDALPIIVLGALVAFVPVERGIARSPLLEVPPRILQICAVAVSVMVASSWISVRAVEGNLLHKYSRSYVTTALSQLEADASVVLVDAPAPPVEVVVQPVSTVFHAAGLAPRFDRPTTDLKIVDGFGKLVPVGFFGPTYHRQGPRKECGWLVDQTTSYIPVEGIQGSFLRVIRIGYLSGKRTQLSIEVNGQSGNRLALAPRLGYAYVTVRSEVRSVQLSVNGENPICVSDITVGQPWPTTP